MSYCSIPDCFRPVENKDTGLCASHGKLQRDEGKLPIVAKVKAPVKSAKKIKPRSDKRQMEERIYNDLSKVWLVGKVCIRCGRPATMVHHAKGRENGLLLLVEFWKPIDFDCHEWVTKFSKESIELGYSLPRNHETI